MTELHVPRRVVVGLLIGLAVGVILELAFSSAAGATYTPGNPDFLAQFGNENTAVLIKRLIYAGLGGIMGGASAIFDHDRLSITAATGLHFVVTMIPLLGSAMFLRWAPVTLGGAVGFLLVAAGVYVLIWAGMFLRYRSEVARMNRALALRRGEL